MNICIMIESSQRAFTFITSFECQKKEMSRADVRLLFLTTRNLQQVAIMGDNTMEEWSTVNLNFNPRFETQGLFHRHNIKCPTGQKNVQNIRSHGGLAGMTGLAPLPQISSLFSHLKTGRYAYYN